MRLYQIDDNGLFVGDIPDGEIPADENGVPDSHYITTPCPAGFYWPRWNGTQWVEGGTSPAPTAQSPTLEEQVAANSAAIAVLMGV